MENEGQGPEPRIKSPALSLPKGGGAVRGINENFESQAFRGGFEFSIPVPSPDARGVNPNVTIEYSSGGGNGILGLGFNLSLSSIGRKTTNGIPRYRGSDTFVLSGSGSLVPALAEDTDGRWQPIRRLEPETDPQWEVISYRPLQEDFSSIEWWQSLTDSRSHWKLWTTANVRHIYGLTEQARIFDPDHPERVFQWLIEETCDPLGNRIQYSYRKETQQSVSRELSETGHDLRSNRYIDRINYGNLTPDGSEYAFSILFGYGQFNVDQPDQPAGQWSVRPDPFSSYRSGFEIRTLRRCQNIFVQHSFPDQFEGQPFLTRALSFEYNLKDQVSPLDSPLSFIERITEVGYRKEEVGYTLQFLPPMKLEYTPFEPADQSFRPMTVLGPGTLPGPLSKGQFLPIDMDGAGLPGLLFSDQASTLYWKPQGKGTYGGPVQARLFPMDKDLTAPQLTVTSLDANGQNDLLVRDVERSGYYASEGLESWSGFNPFTTQPTDLTNPIAEMVDTNGDGRADVLVMDEPTVYSYPSLGKNGFGCADQAPKRSDFPNALDPGMTEKLDFADLFGDGLAHRVRVRSGSVECWPNLGYGKYGSRIGLANPPVFESQWRSDRLFIVDIDGSGCSDLVYVAQDHFKIWFNLNGNGFTDPIQIALPQPFDDLSQVSFADVNGNGTACFIITRFAPEVIHDYYDFSPNVKPYLLSLIDQQMGSQTRVTYTTSSKQYLLDQKQGRSWATKLFFPIQVVAQIDMVDHISNSHHTSRYRYHDGYYDPQDRVFQGFGYVECWDTQEYESFQGDGTPYFPVEDLNRELIVPPTYKRTWFHTGAYVKRPAINHQARSEYWHGDPDACQIEAFSLGPELESEGSETIRQAFATLAGQVKRSEVYGQDGSVLAGDPYTVKQTSSHARLIQPVANGNYAVFSTSPRETLTSHYERNRTDPRVQHQFVLRTDAFGNPLRQCQIAYPRRSVPNLIPEQSKLRIVVEESSYINHPESSMRPYRWIGVPSQQRGFEIEGVAAPNGCFDFHAIETEVELATQNQIPFGTCFTPGVTQARLTTWSRTYYWDSDLTRPLPHNEIEARGLIHHEEQAQISKTWLETVFDQKLDELKLIQSGYWLDQGYWWNRGLIQYYFKDPLRFYQVSQTDGRFPDVNAESALNPTTTVEYDTYLFQPTRVTQYVRGGLGDPAAIVLNVSVELDYRTMNPWRMTDANDNLSEVRFDALGAVEVMTMFGSLNGQPEGDRPLSDYRPQPTPTLQQLIEQPEVYLQDATAYFYYDRTAWSDRFQPVSASSLRRQIHVSQLPTGVPSPIQISVTYSDGFAREVEEKKLTDPGSAIQIDERGDLVVDASGSALTADTKMRWIVSGRTVYNNKGKPAQQYLPYFSNSAVYEDQKQITDQNLVPPPTVTHYDPLGRPIRIDSPKGFFSRVAFASWDVYRFDEDDTVKDSYYYQNFPTDPVTNWEKNERDALDKAAVFFDTPTQELLDPMGRTVRILQNNLQPYLLTTVQHLDINGKTVRLVDPRLFRTNLENGTDFTNFTTAYDMLGNDLHMTSADAGPSWHWMDIFGQTVWRWNGRGFRSQSSYDRLQRLISTQISESDPAQSITNRFMVYGESIPDPKEQNLNGQVYRDYDPAGLLENAAFSINGRIVNSSRRVRMNYRQDADWTPAARDQILAQTAFQSSFQYNALDQITNEQAPDKTETLTEYNLAGQVNRMVVRSAGEESPKAIVQKVEYDAQGQRTIVEYGNGVRSHYTYEESTLRLVKIQSDRESMPGQELQNIEITYDPVGNITRKMDRSFETQYHNNQVVEPLSDYTYDAVYHNVSATGRQNAGLGPERQLKKNDSFKSKPGANIEDVRALENYLQRFSYDDSGNLTKIQHTASQSWTRDLPVEEKNNRLSQFQYDADGNMQALDHLRHMVWNAQNQLSRVDLIVRESGINDREFYLYDGSGNRVLKVFEQAKDLESGSIEIDSRVYIGNYQQKQVRIENDQQVDVILVRESVSVMDDHRRVCLIHHVTQDKLGRESTSQTSPDFRFLLEDNLGSVSLELNDSGEWISYEEYFPYGGCAFQTGNNVSQVDKEYRYSGKELDTRSGLYYYGSRYYPTWLGRWINPDPSGPSGGVNLYAFVDGNPISKVDEQGNMGTWLATLTGSVTTLAIGVLGGKYLGHGMGTKSGAFMGILAGTIGSGLATYLSGGTLNEVTIAALYAGGSALLGTMGGIVGSHVADLAVTGGRSGRSAALRGSIVSAVLGGLLGGSLTGASRGLLGQGGQIIGAVTGAGSAVLTSGSHIGFARVPGGGEYLPSLLRNPASIVPAVPPPDVKLREDRMLLVMGPQGEALRRYNRTFGPNNEGGLVPNDVFREDPSSPAGVGNPAYHVVAVHGLRGYVVVPTGPGGEQVRPMRIQDFAQYVDNQLTAQGFAGDGVPIKFISCFGGACALNKAGFNANAQVLAEVTGRNVIAFPGTENQAYAGPWKRYP